MRLKALAGSNPVRRIAFCILIWYYCAMPRIGSKPNWDRRAFSSEEVEEMKRLYLEEGMTQQEIAEQFHCFRTTVGSYLKEAGVPNQRNKARGEGLRIPSEEIRRVAFFYENVGLTVADIARMLRMEQSGVLYRLKLGGVKMRPRHQTRIERERLRRRAERNLARIDRYRRMREVA